MKHKGALITIGFWVILQSCSGWKHSRDFNYYELNCQDFQQKINEMKESYLLIDVRTPKEFNKSHLKGALNISYFGGGFSDRVDSLNNKLPVYMYCHTQHRSPLAARIMKKKGFKTIYDLKGGFIRWEKKEFPIIGKNN